MLGARSMDRDLRLRRAAELVGSVAIAVVAGLIIAKLGNADDQLKTILVGLAGLSIVVAALEPVFALAMLLVLVPFQFRFTAAGIYTGTNEALILGLATVLVWRIRASAIPAWARVGGLALLAGAFLSVIGAERPEDALWGAVRWTGALVLFFAAFGVLRDADRPTRRLMEIFACTAVVVSIFAMAQRAGITAIVGPPFEGSRVDSFFGYYTAYAGFVSLAAVLVTGEVLQAWTDRESGRAMTFGAALPIILLGVAVSLSRGALLCLGAGWFVLLVLSARRGALLFRAAAVLAAFAVAGFLATPEQTRTTFAQRFSTPIGWQFADRTRAALQETGQEALRARPLGLGYGNFSGFLQRRARSRFVNQAFFHSHQLPTQVGVDAGWLGLFGFAVIALAPFVLAAQALARGHITARGAGFVAAMAGFLAQGMFDYLLYEIAFLIFFCMLSWGAWRELAGGSPAQAQERVVARAGVLASPAGP